jgi:hypothetical protein
MSKRLDEWTIDYYRGALDAAKRESKTLVEHAQVMEGRVEQFDRLLQRLAAGTWKPMHEAPKDGTHILIRFEGGLVQVCYWDEWEVGGEQPQVYGGQTQTVVQGSPPDEWESGWVIAGDPFVQIHEEPIAWAEILSEPAQGKAGKQSNEKGAGGER